MIERMLTHPAAEIPPPLAKEDLDALRASIAEVGLLRPILLFDGKIIDGRNRYAVCVELGIEPKYETYSGSLTPLDLVKANLAHRHMTAGQKAITSIAIAEYEAVEAKERQRQGYKQRARTENQHTKKSAGLVANLPQGAVAPVPGSDIARALDRGEIDCLRDQREAKKEAKKPAPKSRDKAAAITGASARNVSTAKKLQAEAPDLAAEVATGKTSIHAADRKLKERQQRAELEAVVTIELPEGLHAGDFRELSAQIPDNSVDLVFTDPPYDRDSAPLYGDAARIAARILKPGGSFIAYTGQVNLPEVLATCSEHLRYWWTIAGVHSGGNQIMNKYGIRCGWKPLVWFVKGTRGDVQSVLFDVVTGDREKQSHEWQQAESEARYYIENLTFPGGVVVDFFGGGGTTMVAAKALDRRCIMFEINPASAERIAKRVAA